jgi:hypothetical protein
MSSGFWKRASASLTVGALTALLASPLVSLASPAEPARLVPASPSLEQGHGFGQCLTLGSGGLQGAGTQSIGLGQIYSLGAGGFYGPSYSPVYSGYGLGTVSGFQNFSGGQPSRLATLAGSSYCQGLGLNVPAPTGAPFLVRDFGTTPSSTLGYVGSGFGPFGQNQQQGTTGFNTGFHGFFPPYGLGGFGGFPFGFGGFIPR